MEGKGRGEECPDHLGWRIFVSRSFFFFFSFFYDCERGSCYISGIRLNSITIRCEGGGKKKKKKRNKRNEKHDERHGEPL